MRCAGTVSERKTQFIHDLHVSHRGEKADGGGGGGKREDWNVGIGTNTSLGRAGANISRRTPPGL